MITIFIANIRGGAVTNHGRYRWCLFIFLFLIFGSVQAGAEVSGEAVHGEYLVQFDQATRSVNEMAMILEQMDVEVLRVVSEQKKIIKIKASDLDDPSLLIQDLKEHPQVKIVEPNYIYRISAKPNDGFLKDLWGLSNQQKAYGGVDIDAEKAWDLTRGSRNVLVGVIDTGINYRDRDLINNMWVNQREKNGRPGVDDDGNGYVDDIYGYDFANDDGDPMDDNDHGTHCAGTIGAEGNNNYGVVGVNWRVKMMALKFLRRAGGGSLDDAIRAIDYAIDKKVDVLNNSWGGGGKSVLLENAIKRARNAGILFVASAGNNRSNNDRRPSYPASYQVDNVISVAAIDSSGDLANFSNYGRNGVHVAAPGVDILSTSLGGLKYLSGTSMAGPHVAGIAALLLARRPSMNFLQLKNRIQSTSVSHPGVQSKVRYGIVNAYNALINRRSQMSFNEDVSEESLLEDNQ